VQPDNVNRTGTFWTILFGALCLLPATGFILHKLATPSDGARLSTGVDLFTTDGAIISPYSPGGSGLQDGDVVTAVDGTDMETWGEALFGDGVPRPAWEFGDRVKYEVLRDGGPQTLTITLRPLPLGEILSTHWGVLLFALVSQLVAGFVYWRRQHDPAALALFLWAFSGSHTYAWSFFLDVGDIVGGSGFWLFRAATPLLWLIYWPASTHMALVFPKPLPVVRRRPFLIPAVYLSAFAIFFTGLGWAWFRSDNILIWLNAWGPVDNLVAAIHLTAMLTIMTVQYRKNWKGAERKQMRWVVYGAIVSGGGGLLLWIGLPSILGRSILNANTLGLLVLPFPISLAIAIWRHHLFDIDLIIRRTLVYTVLTTLLALVYFSSILFLQTLFSAVTDQQSPLIIVLSTLAIAALFNPLRGRVQDFIDRRFYRSKYDAERVLTQFAETARDEVDIEQLTTELLAVVEETMQPERVSLWLRPFTNNKGSSDSGKRIDAS